VIAALSTIGAAIMPALVTKAPLVLIAMSPLFRHLVLVAPSVDTVSLFAVGLPRHFLPDPFMYLLGRDYGPAAIDWVETNSPMAGRMLRTLEAIFAKIGVFALLIWPDLLFSTFAGAARVPVGQFVVFNVLGTIGTIGVAKFFGTWLTVEIGMVTGFFGRHLVPVTIASIVIIALLSWRSKRGQTEDGAAP
jgi:membrane protein DedA with SNARE-associated domain